MKKTPILILIITVLGFVSNSAHAFDNDRRGLQIGLGLGVHSTNLDYENELAPSSIDAEGKLVVSVSIGYGFSDRFAANLQAKSAGLSIDGEEAGLGIIGIGGSLYLPEISPSLYLTGLVGGAGVATKTEPDEEIDAGLVWSLGFGKELTDRLHLEFNYANADLTDETTAENKSSVESSSLLLRYVWK